MIDRYSFSSFKSNNIGRFILTWSFGKKYYKSKFFDIKFGDVEYIRSKTIVSKDERSYTQPHHLKELENEFILENMVR